MNVVTCSCGWRDKPFNIMQAVEIHCRNTHNIQTGGFQLRNSEFFKKNITIHGEIQS